MNFTYSSIACSKRCMFKYYLKYMLWISSTRFIKPLEMGSYVHMLLDRFYMIPTEKDLTDVELRQEIQNESEKYFQSKVESLFEEETEKRDEFAALKIETDQIVKRYMDKYMYNDMSKYTTLWCEKEFAIKIRDLRNYKTKDVLRGKLDAGLVDEFDTSWLFENKTTSESIADRLNFIDIDEQMSTYTMACSYLPELLPNFGGSIYNVIRKKAPTIPKVLQRPAGSLSKAINIDTTYEVYMETILANGLNPNDYLEILGILKAKGDTFYGRKIVARDDRQIRNFRQMLYFQVRRIKDIIKQFEKTHTDNVFAKNATYMCTRDCEYCQLCIMHSKNADWKNYAANAFTVRDRLNPELEGVEVMD